MWIMIIYLFQLVFLCTGLQVINKVKVTYQSQGHTSMSRSDKCQGQINVTSKKRNSYVDGLHLNKRRSC